MSSVSRTALCRVSRMLWEQIRIVHLFCSGYEVFETGKLQSSLRERGRYTPTCLLAHLGSWPSVGTRVIGVRLTVLLWATGVEVLGFTAFVLRTEGASGWDLL